MSSATPCMPYFEEYPNLRVQEHRSSNQERGSSGTQIKFSPPL